MTDGAGGRSRRPSPVAPDGPTIWEVRIVSTDRSTAAYVLSGGPAEGVVQTKATSKDGRVWTISVVHVNCACEWCAKVEGAAVEHVYERRDDDVFIYRESRESTDA